MRHESIGTISLDKSKSFISITECAKLYAQSKHPALEGEAGKRRARAISEGGDGYKYNSETRPENAILRRRDTEIEFVRYLIDKITTGVLISYNPMTQLPVKLDQLPELLEAGLPGYPGRIVHNVLLTDDFAQLLSELHIAVLDKETNHNWCEKLVTAGNQNDSAERYSTDKMDIMYEAIEEFFSNRQQADAKKDAVVEWIIERAKSKKVDISQNIAEAMFTIIKPVDHNPKSRRPH